MRRIKNIFLFLILVAAFSCIKPYNPEITSSETQKFVIAGRVTGTEGWQEVKMSLTSAIGWGEDIPLEGCLGEIRDNYGNSFPLSEYEPGSYHVWMDQENLQPGTAYQLIVHPPDGSELISAFDTLPSGPPLDSVYYDFVTEQGTGNIALQFYVDLNAQEFSSRYFKWEIVETWEYHSPHVLEYYYDGEHHRVIPPDSSNWTCYVSGIFPEIFTLSTRPFASNSYHKFLLHQIDGTSSRLSVLYSILVKQLTISEAAYNYWDELRTNSQQEGGLYEKQPLTVKGNMQDITNPDKDVLGYFYAAAESERRYFYKDIGIELNFKDYCMESSLGRFGWREFGPRDFPVYYYYNKYNVVRILDHECVDCKMRGGTTTKPDFWPE